MKKGPYFEKRAQHHLEQQGWKLVTANYSCKMGEIDLIMLNPSSDILSFIEVRFRQNNSHGGSISSISSFKQQKIIRTAEHFLVYHPKFYQYPLRFDAICFEQDNKLYWIQDSFRVE